MFVVLFAPLLSVAIFVVSPISAFGKMALAGGGVSAQSLSPSVHCFLEGSGGGRDVVGKVLYGWVNKMTWKIQTRTPCCWGVQGWNEPVTAGQDGCAVRICIP